VPTFPEPEIYTPERKAEFLLNNALSADEYRWAVEEACRLGIDPTRLEHIFRDEPWQNPALYLPEIAIAALRK
jgi:hypothetical protein